MSHYTQDISGCLEEAIGDNGLNQRELDLVAGQATEALRNLQQAIKAGHHPFATLDGATNSPVTQVEEIYDRLADGARTVMFFGCGDAGLIGQAIAQFGGWGIPGVMSGTQRQRPVTRFYSSPDPVTMAGALGRSDLERTRFVFVSRAADLGTISQAIAAIDAVRKAGHEAQIAKLFLIVSGAEDATEPNALQKLAQQFDIPTLRFPAGLDDGFAAFTTAGLLPATARGLDSQKILAGGRAVMEELRAADTAMAAAAAQAATIAVGLKQHRNCQQQIIMPFDDRLGELAGFWAQRLSACDQQGAYRAAIASCGPQDRQQYLQPGAQATSPRYLTLIQTETAGTGPMLSSDLAKLAGVEYLANGTLGSLVAAEQRATAKLLKERRQPVRRIRVAQLDELVLGALLMHMMLESVLTAEMLGTDPFGEKVANDASRYVAEALLAVQD